MSPRLVSSPWYIEDSFNDDDGVLLPAHTPNIDVVGGGWTDVIAGADIVGVGNYLFDNSAARQAVIDSGQSDVEVNSQMKIAGGGTSETGLIFRYQDASNYLWAGMDQLWHRPVMYKVIATVATEIGLAANSSLIIGNDVNVTERITAVGSTLRFYLDGVLYLDVVDAQFQTATICGIRSDHAGASCTWYDFRVGRVLK